MAKFFKHTDAGNSKGGKVMATVTRYTDVYNDDKHRYEPAEYDGISVPDRYIVGPEIDNEDRGRIEIDKDDDTIYLDILLVADYARRDGVATALMTAACADFDRFGVDVHLSACPMVDYDDNPIIDIDSLVKFYESFGFEIVDFNDDVGDIVVIMTRKPKGG